MTTFQEKMDAGDQLADQVIGMCKGFDVTVQGYALAQAAARVIKASALNDRTAELIGVGSFVSAFCDFMEPPR